MLLDDSGFVIEQRYSQWQKKKVRTIIVNAHSKSIAQKSISSALNIAKPYDRIELTGGEYQEALTITFPLELVASEGEDPVIVSRNSGITVTSEIEVYLENLHVLSKGTTRLDAAVVTMAGSVVIFRCKLNSLLIGGTSKPHVENCIVTDSTSGYGISVQDFGGGTIQNTTVHGHRLSCVDIDTRGELKITESTLYNYQSSEGDVVTVSGSVSSIARDVPGQTSYLSCSRVEVSKCQIFITDQEGPRRRSIGSGSHLQPYGAQCCVAMASGAAPTFSNNELVEGEIGFLFDNVGAAQLRGNVIRCQRRCGALAFVEDTVSYTKDRSNLCITGDNVFDRCSIGIDVQCSFMRTMTYQIRGTGSDTILSNDLPHPKRVFRWSQVVTPGASKAVGALEGDYHTTLHGEYVSANQIKQRMHDLAVAVLEAYPTCLSPAFAVASASAMVASLVTSQQKLVPGSLSNVFAELLNATLEVKIDLQNQNKESAEYMNRVRGNQGIDIINTKFSNCGACAVRFGRQGYGLVEDCIFEDCGTHAVVVDCGAHPLITGCRFLRSRKAAIVVANFANPLIIGNEIANGQMVGVALTNLSRGLLIGNMIFGNQGAGIHVEQNSQPVICGNAIVQNRSCGTSVESFSQPHLLFNHFSGNGAVHLHCSGSSDAFVAYNYMQSSPDVGVRIDSLSRCTFVKNNVSLNGDGMLVELDADPVVEDNVFEKNLRSGIVVQNNGLGTFLQNRIVENAGPNVLVQDGASPTFRANRIEKGYQGGIVAIREGSGLFEMNHISENSVANVLLADSYTAPTFILNSIFKSTSGCGIVAARGATGVFQRNQIYENKQGGVYVISKANPRFFKNHIAREAIGVIVSSVGKGDFEANTVDNCYGTGVLVQREGDPVLKANEISGCKMSGLQVAPDGIGQFMENKIFENDIGVQLGSTMESAEVELHSVYIEDHTDPTSPLSSGTMSRPSVSQPSLPTKGRKSILANIASAASARHSSCMRPPTGRITSNDIYHNENGGVLLERNVNIEMEDNRIYENKKYGVRGDTSYTARRAKRVLEEKFSIVDIAVARDDKASSTNCSATLRNNKIYSHQKANIYMIEFDGVQDVRVEENDIYGAPMGIYIGNNSSLPLAERNRIHHCYDGVYADTGGRGEFSENTIEYCQYVGIFTSSNANPQFVSGNTVQFCGVSGVLVDAGGRGLLQAGTIRHCSVGVISFSGAAAASSVTREEIVKANIASSSARFVENTIEENECHGVLICSVISGAPLRTPLPQQKADVLGNKEHFMAVPYTGASQLKSDEALATLFLKNKIRRNRLCGVYHDRFEHWNLRDLGSSRSLLSPNRAAEDAAKASAVKNAYGGYEILLGTSLVMNSENHLRERQEKQVSFVENTITECSIGFSAGYGCHPFLLRNVITKNTFIGLLLRFGSAVTTHGCEFSENGLAGVYASKGAKGQVTRGRIKSNNTLCRVKNSPHDARDFTNAVFCERFETVSRSDPSIVVNAETFERGTLRSYEQMYYLVDVHMYAFSNAIRMLAELTAASSAGNGLASGCAPSTLVSGGKRTTDLGGLGIEEYLQVCAADGGIGIWVEDGSRVSVRSNIIEKHQHVGVFMSKGIPDHHKVLYGSYHMDVVPMRDKTKRNIMTGGEDLEAPPLATADPAALFTPAALCASGAVAARQVALNAEMNMSFSMLHMSISISDPEPKAPPMEKSERQDSIHHATIADNQITENQFGVFIELFEELQTNSKKIEALSSQSSAGVASSFNEDGGAAYALSKQDLRVLDWTRSTGGLDFSVVIEKNNITANKSCGVYCQHIVQVHASPVVPSRMAIQEKVATQYERFQADLVMGRSVTYPTTHTFSLVPVAGKVGNAHIHQNEIHANLGLQGFVTSRYVVHSADHHKTLLQFDTTATPQGSPFCSKVLFAVPFYAALLQLPPPGLVLWEGNNIRDAYSGIQLCGYLCAQCTRFEKNTFSNITGDALSLVGHMASASIGGGNRFEQNFVSVNIKTAITPQAPCYGSPDFRTRIYRNTFRSAKDSGILTDCTGVDPLVCRNEFTDFDKGTAALFLCSTTLAVVLTNVFHDSFSPVVVVRGPQPTTEEPCCNALLAENYFYGNYIGALVCNGAVPRFERNLFRDNVRSGLEIQGLHTAPVVVKCVFKQHKRDPDNTEALDATVKKLASTGSRALLMRYPANGKIQYRGGAVVVDITPENEHVLDLSSTVSLPAGVLIGPEAQGVLEECVFRDNDIGIDSVRDAITDKKTAADDANNKAATATGKVPRINTAPIPTGTALVQACVFHKNQVAGVLARGTSSDADTALASPSSLAASLRRTVGAVSNASFLMQTMEVAVAGTGADKPLEAALIERCYFIDNVNDASSGDAITIDRGYTVFRNNLFTGTVHGLFNGLSLFEENYFFPHEALAKNNPSALELHEGSKLRFERNTIVGRGFGIQTLPNCGGRILQNRIVGCVNGISVAPFSTAAFVQNYVWQSEDCAIVAYGGMLTENEVFEAPTGIIVQSPSVYKTINAIPQNMRTGLDLNVSQNSISFCTSDGFLVASPGKFEGNHVNKCKIGFNVVCPETTDAKKVAYIKNNFAYDNGIGVFLENKSMSTVEDNDIFDNDEMGLVVLQSAVGTLQNNRISSAREQGAIEMPSETRVKSLSNTIRNQFSPAFNRGVRISRNKEYDTKTQSVHRDINQLTSTLNTTHEQDVALSNSLFALVSKLEELHGKSVVSAATAAAAAASITGTATLAGSPSRALLRLSVPSLAQANDTDNAHVVAVPSSTKSARAQSGKKKSAAHSSFAAAARKKVKPGSAGDHTQRPVLVHVLTTATVPAKAAALGNSVVKVLALAPMSKMSFLTTVSTSPSQLTTYLETTTPSLCFLVVDRSMGELRHLDAAALQTLHTKMRSTTRQPPEFCLCYVIVPKGCAQIKATIGAESMTLAEFASGRTVFTYDSSVDGILSDMQKKIAADIQDSGDSASSKLRVSIAAASTSDDIPFLSTPLEASADNHVVTPKLSREKVGNLLSLITPEALGYGTKEPAPKKRKSSVAATTGTAAANGTRRTSRASSAKRRKSSVKTGQVTLRTPSPNNAAHANRATDTSTPTPKKAKRRKSSVVVKVPKEEEE